MSRSRWDKGRSYASRNDILRNLGYDSYSDYLTSPTWNAIREHILSATPDCLACGSPATQIHHIDYSKQTLLGNNHQSLVALCRTCHEHIEFDAEYGNKRSLEHANITLEQLIRKNSSCLQSPVAFIHATTARTIVVMAAKTVAMAQAKTRELAPIRPDVFKDAPQCQICKCWRVTAAVDGVCASCKRRNSKNNCDTATDQQTALGLPSRATTTSNRTVCELGDIKTATYRAG